MSFSIKSNFKNIYIKKMNIIKNIYSSENPLTKIFGPVPTNVVKPPMAAL